MNEQAITLIDAFALLLILVGTIELVVGIIIRVAFGVHANQFTRDVWLHYPRWLIAARTLQLAADIIETSTCGNRETTERVGAIAVRPTFLNYFLDRDLSQVRARQHGKTHPLRVLP